MRIFQERAAAAKNYGLNDLQQTLWGIWALANAIDTPGTGRDILKAAARRLDDQSTVSRWWRCRDAEDKLNNGVL